MLLVTGCGRSGTGYAAKALQAAGINIGHEHLRSQGTSDWREALRSSNELRGYDIVLHQVRHPLHVIASWQVVTPATWDFVYRIIPIDPHLPLLQRSMRYWLWWNAIAELRSSATYQVERFEEEIPKLLGNFFPEADWSKLGEVSKNYNTRKDAPTHGGVLTWDDLSQEDAELTDLILTTARRYGYPRDPVSQ